MLMTDLTIECPEPGIYEDVSFGDYNQWRAISNSAMGLLEKSPRHFQRGERSESTKDQRLGELCHVGVLEPNAFAQRYIVQPPFHLDPCNVKADGAPSDSRATKYCREKEREFAEAHADREIVDKATYESMLAMVVELTENDHARRHLNDRGPVEVSIVWDELTEHGHTVRCKARLDKVALDLGAIVDLKKCQDALRFGRDIAYRKYHRQLAHYQSGWAALNGGELLDVVLVAYETTPPATVLSAQLDEIALIEGREQRDKLLALYVRCLVSDQWPTLPNPSEWTLPEWALSPAFLVGSAGETLEV
jgi:hypothetical protein